MNSNGRYKLSMINKTQSIQQVMNKEMIPKLVKFLTSQRYYDEMLDVIDRSDVEDYSQFNDLQMMYLFVHEEKDQDEKKNRTIETKKEYLRELLWIYHIFVTKGERFDFHADGLDVSSICKEVKPRHIRKFQDWLKKVPLGKGHQPYSIATISRKTGIFKSFLSFLYEKKYIVYPVHQSFKSANVHHRDRPNRDLHTDEAIQLLYYYKEHPIIHSLLAVLLTTGARIREVCTARICDLSYGKNGYWLEVIGKGKEKRELFIYPNVYDTIVKFRERRGLETYINKEDTEHIFVTARNKPYSYKYLSKYLSEAITKADLPFIKDKSRSFTPHTLRHGFAIISAEQDADVFRIMQALGHKKIETTMIYLEKHAQRKNHAAHTWKDSSIIKSI